MYAIDGITGPHGWQYSIPAGRVLDEAGELVCTFTEAWGGKPGGYWPPSEIIVLPSGGHPRAGVTASEDREHARLLAFVQGFMDAKTGVA